MKIFKITLPIPNWIVCVAGRFTLIHTSLEALRGPHQSEWRQNSLCNQALLIPFVFDLSLLSKLVQHFALVVFALAIKTDVDKQTQRDGVTTKK
jgi:hypothetical protein